MHITSSMYAYKLRCVCKTEFYHICTKNFQFYGWHLTFYTPPQFPVAKCCKTCTCSCYFRMAFKHCCQWLKIALLMVLLPRHMICLTENLISLTKLHQFLVCFFHLLRKSAELVSVGMCLICES